MTPAPAMLEGYPPPPPTPEMALAVCRYARRFGRARLPSLPSTNPEKVVELLGRAVRRGRPIRHWWTLERIVGKPWRLGPGPDVQL